MHSHKISSIASDITENIIDELMKNCGVDESNETVNHVDETDIEKASARPEYQYKRAEKPKRIENENGRKTRNISHL